MTIRSQMALLWSALLTFVCFIATALVASDSEWI
jgi:hypothetical protein